LDPQTYPNHEEEFAWRERHGQLERAVFAMQARIANEQRDYDSPLGTESDALTPFRKAEAEELDARSEV
jgi:hypothetical protein